MVRYSFKYSPLQGFNMGKWFPKGDTWKTRNGAEKGAERWERAMQDEGCPVQTAIILVGRDVTMQL